MQFDIRSLIIAVLCLFCSASYAQLQLPVSKTFRRDIQKIVAEFPSQFASLRGALLVTNPQTVEYASLLQVDKSEACTITAYSYNYKPIYSLQALMLLTEDFAEAEKRYKWIFQQLRGMNITHVVDKYTLYGVYEAPAEERKFTTSTLAVKDPPEALYKLRIEVSMNYAFPEWKVAVNIFEKEKDDEAEAGNDY